MSNNLLGKDIIATTDWTKSELDQVLDLAFKLKKKGAAACSLDIAKGKTLLLLFFRKSTRTRTSFTAAMQELGGFVQSPDPSDLRLSLEDRPGAGESLKDTARVMERYADAAGIRNIGPVPDEKGVPRQGFGDALCRKFADYASIPVINLGCDLHHPTQALADMMVMKENLGDVKGKKLVMMWAYSPLLRGQQSPMSDGLIAALYGMNITFVYPEGYDMESSIMSRIQKDCTESGGKFEISHDYQSALEGADIVFPRNWFSLGHYQHTEAEEIRLASQHKDWKFTESLLRLTNNARFMHVMPFDRGNEVDDSIADGPNSIVYDQAENLVHARKALLASVMVDNLENI